MGAGNGVKLFGGGWGAHRSNWRRSCWKMPRPANAPEVHAVYRKSPDELNATPRPVQVFPAKVTRKSNVPVALSKENKWHVLLPAKDMAAISPVELNSICPDLPKPKVDVVNTGLGLVTAGVKTPVVVTW